jgi:hypothetical protein
VTAWGWRAQRQVAEATGGGGEQKKRRAVVENGFEGERENRKGRGKEKKVAGFQTHLSSSGT